MLCKTPSYIALPLPYAQKVRLRANASKEYHAPQFRRCIPISCKTARHIYEAARGASGPPRIAFPNPVGDGKRRLSVGCLTGPFTTGMNGPDGMDTGSEFMVKHIEDNPAGFFADSHTELFPLGAL